MRIAVLLWGQARFLKETCRSIKEQFKIEGCETDYFYHSWHEIGYKRAEQVGHKNDSVDVSELENKYKELYNVDYRNPKLYNIVFNTKGYSAVQTANELVKRIKGEK